jgi:hypothetical protein
MGWKGKRFFFEKKKQKTFSCWCKRKPIRQAQVAKVFWFFFSKKNRFFFAPSAPAQAGALLLNTEYHSVTGATGIGGAV